MLSAGILLLGGSLGYWHYTRTKTCIKTIECDTGATKRISYWFPKIKDPKKNHYVSPYSLVEIYLNQDKEQSTCIDSSGIWVGHD